MKTKASIALLFVLILVAGAVWAIATRPGFISDATTLQSAFKQKQITIRHSLPVIVEVADTNETRTQGLARRSALLDGHGFLIVYAQDQQAAVWMKEMNFSIDVLFIDSSGIITTLYQDLDPRSYPKTYSSAGLVRYLLELPAGYIEIHNIQVGDSVQL